MRIALGVFAHEADTFSPRATTLADFEATGLKRGAEVLAGLAGLAIEEAGAMGVFGAEAECEVVGLLAARAGSGGPIVAADYRLLRAELLERLKGSLPVAGVFLVLHGAMVADDEPDATGDLLAAVRALVGPQVPVVGTLDLHANVTPRMVAAATALVGYHTAPHIDLFEAGQAAARLLLGTIRGQLAPRMALVKLPLLVPAENARHTDGPLSEVLGMVLEAERSGAILHGAVFAVQPWMDIPTTGCSVLVVTDGDASQAQAEAERFARAFWARRAAFVPELIPPAEAVARALACSEGMIVLCDSADAPTSGSTGDSTVLLQALLQAAPGADQVALLNVVDAPAVARACRAGVGSEVTVDVGGKLAPGFFSPVPFTGHVKLISDGLFRHKGPGMRGVTQRMGRAAVLVQGGIHLVVMEHAVSQWDPELYRSVGLEPRDARLVQVKSPAAFRAAYGPLASAILIVASPGPATPDLASLPWRRLPRPIYPLDEEAEFGG